MTYSRQDVIIHTKIPNEETMVKMAKPIVDFADKHSVYLNLRHVEDGRIVATYAADGNTSAYCKGMVAEIKQMLKDTFNCKISVQFYAY